MCLLHYITRLAVLTQLLLLLLSLLPQTGQVVVDMSGVSDAVSSAKTAVSAGVSSAAKTGAAAKAAAAKAVADGAMSAKDGMNTASKTMQDGVNSAVAAHSKKSKTN